MAGYRVRPAEAADCEEIIRMVMELSRFENLEDQVALTAEGLRRDGFEETSPLFQCLVVEPEDEQKRLAGPRLVGYALYYYIYSTFKGRSLYLEDLYIMPEYRGEGLGSKLFSAVAETALSLGCARLQLSVLEWNQPAISFYQSRGGINLSAEEGWLIYRFHPEHLQRLVSKTSNQTSNSEPS
ncbi:thialysine N-epsilon-acetyltransferase-like [Hyperolius riggenbachi]|uniref:thialysine N-epsilon-acetyltransferase-like n=1 Tax=Hyperolius riggenbachi TaxID=752182 RepID=UPI0035A395D2